jgi:glyoxylase-like metal-dependent hydrolase (beta-lactamase superfamily II)
VEAADASVLKMIDDEMRLLSRVVAVPDELAEGVDLFPLPGYTAGQSGLLVAEPTRTTIIAGDAVPTAGHFYAGRVFEDCFDLEKAKESLSEMYEISDIIVPGHDNLFVTPRGS